jgi:hypothetical protein
MVRHLLMTSAIAVLLISCDPEGRQKCQWTLEPEPKNIGKTLDGYIPVCARNRTKNVEDCRFQSTLVFAEGAWMKKFRYVDIDADATHAPKIIRKIKYCDKDE